MRKDTIYPSNLLQVNGTKGIGKQIFIFSFALPHLLL